MHIVRAKPEDAAVLTEIAFAAKRHWGYPQEWIESWRDILTMRPEFIEANVAWCAREDDQVLGFYVLTTESDGLHLDHLWIMPSAMGRGIGRALFGHATLQARALDHAAFKIEADPNAEGFYQRMGAKHVGANITRVGETRRELPVLLYKLERASLPNPGVVSRVRDAAPGGPIPQLPGVRRKQRGNGRRD